MRSFILVALPLASAMIHDISVGKGGLRYDPEMLTVAKDDTLRFHFYSEHNVAQSSFDKPCQPIDKGLFSGTIEAKGMTESVRERRPMKTLTVLMIVGVISGPGLGRQSQQHRSDLDLLLV